VHYRDEGVVLRTIRLGEADRIVTIVTPGHGKVRAVAKGVRRTKSRFGARLEPLSHVALLCWRGRDLDVVTGVEVIDSFRAVRDDLGRLQVATTMLEIVDQVAQERHGAPAVFTLLVRALRTLERDGAPLVLGAFCLKLLAIEGVGPVVDACASCGRDGPLVAFDAGEGGFLCATCRRGRQVSPPVVELARQVLSGGLARALSTGATPAVAALEDLAIGAVEHHLDRRLRSVRHPIGAGGRPEPAASGR